MAKNFSKNNVDLNFFRKFHEISLFQTVPSFTIPTRQRRGCVTTLGKLFTPTCPSTPVFKKNLLKIYLTSRRTCRSGDVAAGHVVLRLRRRRLVVGLPSAAQWRPSRGRRRRAAAAVEGRGWQGCGRDGLPAWRRAQRRGGTSSETAAPSLRAPARQ